MQRCVSAYTATIARYQVGHPQVPNYASPVTELCTTAVRNIESGTIASSSAKAWMICDGLGLGFNNVFDTNIGFGFEPRTIVFVTNVSVPVDEVDPSAKRDSSG